MSCGECDKCRALGYKFCIKCGQSFAEEANVPEHHIAEEPKPFFDLLVVPAIIVTIIALIIDAAFIVIDFPLTFEWLFNRTDYIVLYPFDFIRLMVKGQALQAYWFVIAVALISAALVFIYDSRDAFRPKEPNYRDRWTATPLFWLSLLLGSTMLIEIVLSLILSAMGSPIVIPSALVDLPLEKALFLFSEAAFWEEICFRLFIFGVPMMMIAAIARQKDFYKYPLGGFGVTRIGVIMMIISAIIFAYAHVDGWGFSKMFTVIIGGLVFGYLFMRFGIHVSMMAHMITDFSGVLMAGMDDFTSALLILSILVTGFICIVPLLIHTVKGVGNLKTMRWIGKPVPAAEAAAPEFADDITEECYDDDLQAEPEEVERIQSADAQDDSQGPRMD